MKTPYRITQTDIPKGMKSFNIEDALKDVSKVRTRDRRRILQISYADKSSNELYPVLFVDDEGFIETCDIMGVWNKFQSESDNDLFLIADEQAERIAHVLENGIIDWSGNDVRLTPGKYKLVKID